MYGKTALLVTLLVVGSLALPKPEVEDDMSMFFDHTTSGTGSRIVGGVVAARGSAPHMVALTNGVWIRSLVCGGSVVTRRHVMTAAHCIVAVFLGSLSSSLRGTVGSNTWNLGGEMYAFSGNITHENYLGNIIKNDIGLLITNEDIRFGELVAPVPLTYQQIDGGVAVKVTGWGRIRAGGAISSELLELRTATIGGQECVEGVERAANELNMLAPPVEPHIEICTYHSPGFGTCNGDSGSALVRLNTGEQVGVVSWGFPCALGAPDMFARISGFTDWIQRNLRTV